MPYLESHGCRVCASCDLATMSIVYEIPLFTAVFETRVNQEILSMHLC